MHRTTFAVVPFVLVGAAALAAVLWRRESPEPPPAITATVTKDPLRTVTITDELPKVALVPLRASTELDVPAPDLNGDGVPEHFEVQPNSCGTGGCVYYIHVTHWPHHSIGTIVGKWGYWTVTPRKGTYADLTVTWFLGCCSAVETTYRYTLDRYREIKQVTRDPRIAPGGS